MTEERKLGGGVEKGGMIPLQLQTVKWSYRQAKLVEAGGVHAAREEAGPRAGVG